jgi:hypothetical protein
MEKHMRPVTWIKSSLLALLLVLPAAGQLTVRFSDASGNTIWAGDNANNALRVNIVAGAAGGASHVDDAAFTVATDDLAPMGALFDDTTPDSVDEDDAGIPRMSANRNLYTTLRDAAGNERGVNVTASNQLEVSVTNNPVLGVSTNNIGDVDVLSFPDNEPFDVAQYGGVAVGVGNAIHVRAVRRLSGRRWECFPYPAGDWRHVRYRRRLRQLGNVRHHGRDH